MNRGMIIGGAFITALLILSYTTNRGERPEPEQEATPASLSDGASAAADFASGLIHGRVTLDEGAVYEGRLRWGGNEEALWSNYFNGWEPENPWASQAPKDQLPKEVIRLRVLGFEIWRRERPLPLGRPLMVRFGDIARIESPGRNLRVVLKSGAVVELDRFSADDLADGLRVWDARHGVVDLGEWKIRSIEFFDAPAEGPALVPLYGTVRTRAGEFTGLIQWNRRECLGVDWLNGRSGGGDIAIRFDNIRSIARAGNGSRVTLRDGRELELSGTREVGPGNAGIHVDDARYGRVLIPWQEFERVDFTPGVPAPSYSVFAAGEPLRGTVMTASGQRLSGRLIFDLDESETIETLDAPSRGIDYTIPFRLIASVELPAPAERSREPARVRLRSGEVLRLEHAGDLGPGNGGVLIFLDGRTQPEYVPWSAVRQLNLDSPARTAAPAAIEAPATN